MGDLDFGLVSSFEKAERVAFQYLGAGALVMWKELKPQVQPELLHSATKIIGLEPMTGVEQQLKALLRRHGQLDA